MELDAADRQRSSCLTCGLHRRLTKYRPLVEELCFPLARSKRQDRGQIAAQYDHQFRTIWHEINAVYQRAKLVGRLCPRRLVAKLVVKSSDLLMIKFCQIGMPQGRWLLRIADFRLHRGFR